MPVLFHVTAVSAFNLAGSIASTFGSSFVIVTHMFLGLRQDSVRSKLILNLALADLLYAINNTTSGIALLLGWKPRGLSCTVNGFVGQLTVVTSDMTILAIAVATVMALRKPFLWHQKLLWVQRYSWVLIISTWTYALATALIALFTVGYARGLTNWCCIAPRPVYYRVALTLGARIPIIIAVIAMYIWIFLTLRRQKLLRNFSIAQRKRAASVGSSAMSSDGLIESQQNAEDAQFEMIMWRILIFPAVFTVLSIPGIINRFYNFSTPGSSNHMLDFLYGLTQWIGFANGVVYGLNAEVKAALQNAFRRAFKPVGQVYPEKAVAGGEA